MKAHQIPGYIIHRRPFGETSAIIDVVAQGYGRINMVLKGVHRPSKNKPALAGLAQVFKPLLFDFGGKSELKTVYAIEDNGVAVGLNDKFLFSGFYINELINRLWPQNIGSDELYLYYHRLLQSLNEVQLLPEPNQPLLEVLLRRFEFELLAMLGFGIDCQYCGDSQQAIEAQNYYTFAPEQGFSLTPFTAPEQAQVTLFKGQSILLIGEGQYNSGQVLKQAKQLIRLALAPHLGNKPIKSRELFNNQ